MTSIRRCWVSMGLCGLSVVLCGNIGCVGHSCGRAFGAKCLHKTLLCRTFAFH